MPLPQVNRCWLIEGFLKRALATVPVCVVQLGRYGDLLQLLPAFRLMAADGCVPTVMVSKEFASVLEAVSYVEPWVVPLSWWQDTARAKQLAGARFERVVVPQYWNDVDGVPETEAAATKLRFTAHGRTWQVEGEAADYGTCMWNRLGFTRAQMVAEPLVLDRRNATREQALVARHVHTTRPLLLYNFTGVCSPFGYTPEMMHLLQRYQSRFEMVDLGAIRASRIYDLLGLYDRAAGLVTIDTATAHLANASRVPTAWLTVDSTGESVPRGNVAFHCAYRHVPKNLSAIDNLLLKWASA